MSGSIAAQYRHSDSTCIHWVFLSKVRQHCSSVSSSRLYLHPLGEPYAIYGSIAAQYRHIWNICTFLPSVAGAFAYAQHQLEYAKPDCNRAVVHTL
jgi:hypothetical protein